MRILVLKGEKMKETMEKGLRNSPRRTTLNLSTHNTTQASKEVKETPSLPLRKWQENEGGGESSFLLYRAPLGLEKAHLWGSF